MIICFAESQTKNKKSLKRDFATFLQKLDSIQANQQKQGDEIRAIRQKLSDDDSSTRTDGENVLRLPVQTALEFDELEDMMEDENVQKQLVLSSTLNNI